MHITVQVRQSTAPALHQTTTPTPEENLKSRRRLSSSDSLEEGTDSVTQNAPQAIKDDAAELLRVADELGVEFEAMHPGTRDAQLRTFFTVEVPDAQAAEHVINRLQQCSAIEAAYLKPMEELP